MSPSAMTLAYWLICAAIGALLSYAVNSGADFGGHIESNGAVGMWLASIWASGGSIVAGGLFAIFRAMREIGIALVAAGLSGLFAGGVFALSWMARAS